MQLTNDYHQKDMIKLSVIIPIYNTPEPLLEHCISSIQENLQQMGDEVEVLLINDGSTVSHIEPMLKAVEAADNRFKYVYKANSGVSDTRNRGIEMAKGEYITFVDSDDYLEPDALQYMVEAMEQSSANVSFFGYCTDDKGPNENVYKRSLQGEQLNWVRYQMLSSQYDFVRLYGVAFIHSYAALFRRNIIMEHNCRFDVRLTHSEDTFFNFCYFTYIDNLYVDNRLVYHYVTNPESATQIFTDKHIGKLSILLPEWERTIQQHYANDKVMWHNFYLRVLSSIRISKKQYYTHPQNRKSFKELKSELHTFLYQGCMRRYIRKMSVFDATDIQELKNIIFLKLHLYWIFLITERRRRRKSR